MSRPQAHMRPDASRQRSVHPTHALALLWLPPLLAHATDAHAWGLYTHMYFAQLLVWATPLADPRFRCALRRWPQLCLAAACLPDVSLFSAARGLERLRVTHRWSCALRMLHTACDEEERAIALGYTSHLLSDIVAHNHFVPAHENLWIRAGIFTHAACEWAMDAHIAGELFVQPGQAIAAHGKVLAEWAARYTGCHTAQARRALGYLARGERTLRASCVPQAIYRVTRRSDARAADRFDEYVRETAARLRQIDRLIAGETPLWRPEIASTRGARRRMAQSGSIAPPPLPCDWFSR